MATKTSEELRREWQEAWVTIRETTSLHWKQLDRDCITVAFDSISAILPRLGEKAWISGKQGHKR